jgi:hypothetical protein
MREMRAAGAPLIPVTSQPEGQFFKLFEMDPSPALDSPDFPDGWVNFYRSDDYSSTAYFYLDKPFSDLPALPPLAVRTEKM